MGRSVLFSEVLLFWGWHLVKMSFLKRKRFKFNVDLQLVHLSDVPLVNAVLFAKVRLLDGGTFEGVTEPVEVLNHSANWNRQFSFTCRIASVPETGVLDKCACRISLRKTYMSNTSKDNFMSGIFSSGEGIQEKQCFPVSFQAFKTKLDHHVSSLREIIPRPLVWLFCLMMTKSVLLQEQKGGKAYQKLGFVDINLSEFAASGTEGIERSYLLDGYGINQRQDNSRLLIKVTMSHQSADPLFKVPGIGGLQCSEHLLDPADRKAPRGDSSSSKNPGSCKQPPTADTDSTHSSSIEDLSHYRDDLCSCSLPSVANAGATGMQESGCYQRNNGVSAFNSLPLNSSGIMQTNDVMRRSVITTNILQSRRLSQDRSQMSKGDECVGGSNRVSATRVDAEDLINKMLAETVIANIDDQDEHNSGGGRICHLDLFLVGISKLFFKRQIVEFKGLELFVSRDGGEAVVAANAVLSTDSFERVHIADATNTTLSTG
ncbi:unnamed protein product [Anisakis simplex]|uniref:C2 NT-type domain-containing protein n=1 Tax=Anisakis simplex TaxID=6269 RepID=A0A0M3JW81_ANISI|nr:unnamed protein product [Anisakis simplex]